jgi:hypothetical protein
MTKSANRKVAARKARSAHSKKSSKRSTEARDRNQKTHQKVAAKRRNSVAAETVRDTHRIIDTQYDQFRSYQVPDTLRVLAEQNVAQTRELYEQSKNTLQAVLESWQKSFGSAGQNAVALSRKMIDVTGRNMDTGFNFAIGLAGARNLGEVMELQAAYWRKLGGALQIQPKTRAVRRNS